MSIDDICDHERRGMMTRRTLGYAQHDDHLWRWLNHHLKEWHDRNHIYVKKEAR